MFYELALMKIPMCTHISKVLFFFQKNVSSFDGVNNCYAWDISHEFKLAFARFRSSISNTKAKMIERVICEILCNIQNSFHSALNAFTALETKHDEIVGKIKPGMEDTKLHDHIGRIIVLFKRWLLQIEVGCCMGTKDKKLPFIKQFSDKASYPFDIRGIALIIYSNLIETPGKVVLLVYIDSPLV